MTDKHTDLIRGPDIIVTEKQAYRPHQRIGKRSKPMPTSLVVDESEGKVECYTNWEDGTRAKEKCSVLRVLGDESEM